MIPFARIIKYANEAVVPEPVSFDEVLQQQYSNVMYLHKPTNKLYGYGSNNYYQLGLNVNTVVSSFTLCAENCAAYWLGVQGSLMIDTMNKIYFSGAVFTFPQSGSSGYTNGWVDVTASFDAIGVQAAMIKGAYLGESTRILLHDGRVLICGRNNYAECGTGTVGTIPTLRVGTGFGSDVTQLACTLTGTHYLKTNKQAWFVGRNNSGESGAGVADGTIVAAAKFITTAVDYISTTYDVCWWFKNNTVYWSGRNNTGQAGNGTTSATSVNTPTLNSTLSVSINLETFQSPSAMGNSSIGTPIAKYPSLVRTGGVNTYGQQGTGNTAVVPTWATLNINVVQGGYNNILMVTKDWCRTIIITKDYKLYACGGFNGGGGNLPNGANTVTTLTLMPNMPWQ